MANFLIQRKEELKDYKDRTNKNVLPKITKMPTQPTLPTQNDQNRSNSVGSVGKMPILGGSVDDSLSLLKQIAQKAMRDDQGNNKGYFTKDDWVYTCQIWPNLHWTENEAEQTLYALLQEGEIQEIEGPGSVKFKSTTEKLNSGAGA